MEQEPKIRNPKEVLRTKIQETRSDAKKLAEKIQDVYDGELNKLEKHRDAGDVKAEIRGLISNILGRLDYLDENL